MENKPLEVLFVDDEVSLLNGLKRSLRRLRPQWNCEFAESGREALELLKHRSFQVIVSDMRMPGMGGMELLDEVRRANPEMVRIVLSGDPGEGMRLGSLGCSHRYLAKPCSTEELVLSVESAAHLRQCITQNYLWSVISGLRALPGLPGSFLQLQEILASPTGSLQQAADLVMRDPTLSVRILQLVNSAWYSRGRSISDTGYAINLIGADVLLAIVLSGELHKMLPLELAREFALSDLFQESFEVANLAKALMHLEKQPTPVCAELFASGLLRECGKLVLIQEWPDRLRLMRSKLHFPHVSGQELLAAEEQEFGVGHGIIGAMLLALWGLPDHIVSHVAFHQNPCKAHAGNPLPVACLHAAIQFVRHSQASYENLPLDFEWLEKIGLDHNAKNWWQHFCALPQQDQDD